MTELLERRDFLAASAAAALWAVEPGKLEADQAIGEMRIAPFRFDVTPPLGHSCCGGWITPVVAVDDSLEAIGFVLLGAGKPIVICAVDWTGLLNSAHSAWKAALAKAAGTTPDRVAVQCVHQHNAPFACLDAQRIVAQYDELPHIVDPMFFEQCLQKARKHVGAAMKTPQRITHISRGQGKVEQVASNRRIYRSEAGRIIGSRSSSCRDEKLRAMPEGLIDPWLKTITFHQDDKPLVSCHYYATHPMSYYGDGRVSSDFTGLARKKRQAEQPDTLHVYFTGCAGNIAAGKYNDGSKPQRQVLADRVYQGMVAAEKNQTRERISQVRWRTAQLKATPRKSLSAQSIAKQIADKTKPVVHRNRPSYMLAWLQRLGKGTSIDINALHIGDTAMLHLPAECFVQYQLAAQRIAAGKFVATAAYGDGGPWYIPVSEEYAAGGYEVSVAFCEPTIDQAIQLGMKTLLT